MITLLPSTFNCFPIQYCTYIKQSTVQRNLRDLKEIVGYLFSGLNKYVFLLIKNLKFLGLDVDYNLTWNQRIDHILKSIYYAHIQSHTSYGIRVYGATAQYNLDKIIRGQKKALRIILQWSEKLRSED